VSALARVRRWFASLHGGQVAMLWIGWGLLWWAMLWIGAGTVVGRYAGLWGAIALVVAFGGGVVLMVLTWIWFGSKAAMSGR
jgi:hypothetical protein